MSLILSIFSNWRALLALGGVLGVLALSGGAYLKGYSNASEKCQTQALKAEIESLKQAIAINRTVQEAATKRALERDEAALILEQKVNEYEAQLESRSGCELSESDARWLSEIK
nr:hypothetical protein [uncultured Cohaesibacter sp.]